MIKRDERYENVISLYKDGKISTLTDLFKAVPRTVIARDLGKNVYDFNKRLKNPGSFKMDELYLIARMCGLEEKTVYALCEDHYKNLKAGKIEWNGKEVKVVRKKIDKGA